MKDYFFAGLVSVLTPTLQEREWFLERCSRSVKAQTYDLVEHIIDDTEGIGPMPAFQACLDQAEGEYVLPLSDDDWLAPHAIERMVETIAGHDVVFAKTLICSPGNDRLVDMGCAVMWRRALNDELGGYDPRFEHAGDSELYGRFVDAGAKFTYCPEPLYFFTEHESHHSFMYRNELKVELRKIAALHPGASRALGKLVA